MRMEPVMGCEPFLTDTRLLALPLSLHYVRSQHENGHLLTRKWALTRPYVCWHLDLGLASLRTVKKECLLFKPRSPWYLDTPRWGRGAPAPSQHGTWPRRACRSQLCWCAVVNTRGRNGLHEGTSDSAC